MLMIGSGDPMVPFDPEPVVEVVVLVSTPPEEPTPATDEDAVAALVKIAEPVAVSDPSTFDVAARRVPTSTPRDPSRGTGSRNARLRVRLTAASDTRPGLVHKGQRKTLRTSGARRHGLRAADALRERAVGARLLIGRAWGGRGQRGELSV